MNEFVFAPSYRDLSRGWNEIQKQQSKIPDQSDG